MISSYHINGLPLQTGDVLCTTNGKPDILPGEFWLLIGRLVPGEVDHVAVYVGPEGCCVEAGPCGVVSFLVPGEAWDAEKMVSQRGLIIDRLVGAAYPLEGRDLSKEDQARIRQEVAAFCLAQVGKPYNINFLDSHREDAFYCSQLVYCAYLHSGLNLNTGLAIETLPETSGIIYPQEIWSGCKHRQAVGTLIV